MVNVVCVKYGTKYTETHVNRLYGMVKRNLSLPFSFYCFTDDKGGLHEDIKAVYLDEDLELEGYWWKFCVFDPGMYDDPNVITLYLDLDIIIQNPIDDLFTASHNKIKTCYTGVNPHDPFRHTPGINSSVMIFKPNQVSDICEDFLDNCDYNILEYFGVCRYLWALYQDRLDLLYPMDDWYSFIKKFECMIGMQIDQYRLQIKSKNITCGAFYNPKGKICLLNGCSDFKILDAAYEFFSDYYK